MKITLYPHGGSGNHGCEALVRSTSKLLFGHDLVLLTKSIEEDVKYGLDKKCLLLSETTPIKRNFFAFVIAYIKSHFFQDKDAFSELEYHNVICRKYLPDVALSIGGDNYCYSTPTYIYIINRLLRKRGVKTILWGCSLESSMITKEMLHDLAGYNLIIARESTTAETLRNFGIKKVREIPDPAFQLDKKELPLPSGFLDGNTVGINVSPMIISYEKNKGATLQNYVNLIHYILDDTDMSIALIPHVVWKDSDDREAIKELVSALGELPPSAKSRICILPDHKCEELKGYISRCRFMVAARTHASIAAYSTCVPTLVVGYSIKAKGIARDIFGTDENYVLPVQMLESDNDLADAFIWIQQHEAIIKRRLVEYMPEYCNRVCQLSNIIK